MLLLSVGCHCYMTILINLTAVKPRDSPKAVLEVSWGKKKKTKAERISSHADPGLAV